MDDRFSREKIIDAGQVLETALVAQVPSDERPIVHAAVVLLVSALLDLKLLADAAERLAERGAIFA